VGTAIACCTPTLSAKARSNFPTEAAAIRTSRWRLLRRHSEPRVRDHGPATGIRLDAALSVISFSGVGPLMREEGFRRVPQATSTSTSLSGAQTVPEVSESRKVTMRRCTLAAVAPNARKCAYVRFRISQSAADVPVVILCGGWHASREATESMPKPMVDIGGKPILCTS